MAHNFLLEILKNEDIAGALTHMADSKKHYKLNIKPNKYSIELYNVDVTVVIVFFLGFENVEYYSVKNKPNLHFVTFNRVIPTSKEFKGLNIKYIDTTALLFMTLALSEDGLLSDLHILKNLDI